MNWLLQHGSYGLLFLALAAAGVGIPIPEDLVLLAGGVLAHRQITTIPGTLITCFVGVLVGDGLMFHAVRRLGTGALDRGWAARLLTPARRQRLERFVARRGGFAVLTARHMPGLRWAVFALIAMHGMPPRWFLLWDAIGLCVSLPVVFSLGYLFSDHLDRLRKDLSVARLALIVLAVVAAAVAAWLVRRRTARRGEAGDIDDRG